MIRDHVAKSAGDFVKTAAVFDANGFCGGNLNVVDVVANPKGLNDVVGKAEDHNILDGFFSKIMIDAVNLFFRQDLFEILVELPGRFQIMAKMRFNDNASPAAVFLPGKSGFAKFFGDGRAKSWRDS